MDNARDEPEAIHDDSEDGHVIYGTTSTWYQKAIESVRKIDHGQEPRAAVGQQSRRSGSWLPKNGDARQAERMGDACKRATDQTAPIVSILVLAKADAELAASAAERAASAAELDLLQLEPIPPCLACTQIRSRFYLGGIECSWLGPKNLPEHL